MPVPRSQGTAVLLPNGMVLLLSGGQVRRRAATAEHIPSSHIKLSMTMLCTATRVAFFGTARGYCKAHGTMIS